MGKTATDLQSIQTFGSHSIAGFDLVVRVPSVYYHPSTGLMGLSTNEGP